MVFLSKILTKSQTELDLLPIPQEAKDVISNIIDKFSDQGHSGSSAGYLIPRVIAYANKTQEEIEQLLYTKLVDNEDEDDMQRWITDNVKDLVREIEPLKGPYLNFYLDVLKKAMHQEAVTPITFEDDQWNDVSEYYGDTEKKTYQHKRAWNVFKESDGKIYQSDYYVFNNSKEDYAWYTNNLSSKIITQDSWVVNHCYLDYDFIKKIFNRMTDSKHENDQSRISELEKQVGLLEMLLHDAGIKPNNNELIYCDQPVEPFSGTPEEANSCCSPG
jgi:hypothetical protein